MPMRSVQFVWKPELRRRKGRYIIDLDTIPEKTILVIVPQCTMPKPTAHYDPELGTLTIVMPPKTDVISVSLQCKRKFEGQLPGTGKMFDGQGRIWQQKTVETDLDAIDLNAMLSGTIALAPPTDEKPIPTVTLTTEEGDWILVEDAIEEYLMQCRSNLELASTSD